MAYSDSFSQPAVDTSRFRASGDVNCSVRRFFGYFFDGIIIGLGMAAALFALGWVHMTTGYATDQLGNQVKVFHSVYTGGYEGYLLGAAVWFGYFIVMEWAAGWTIGKMILGLRVVSLSGEQLSPAQAIIRNVLLPVDTLFFSIPALISMLSSDCRQRIGDRVAGTMVVKW